MNTANTPTSLCPALRLPLFASPIRAGFPSPADDFCERRLDLNDLVSHPEATFYAHARGDSMVDYGIHDGYLLVVDRAEPAHLGRIVVAETAGEFTVKKLGRGVLLAGNPAYPPLPINPESGVTIWGVVTYVIHMRRFRRQQDLDQARQPLRQEGAGR